MKATLAKDLVIGKIYADTIILDEISTFLRFIGTEGDLNVFEYAGGHLTYGFSDDRLIRLGSLNDYGELSESEIEQYLPTNTAKPE